MPIALNFLIMIYVTYKNNFPRLTAYGIYPSFMFDNISHFWEHNFVWNLLLVCLSICKEPPLSSSLFRFAPPFNKKKTGYFKFFDCFNNYYTLPFFPVIFLQTITTCVLTTNIFIGTSQHRL